jgi:hypothetical protein
MAKRYDRVSHHVQCIKSDIYILYPVTEVTFFSSFLKIGRHILGHLQVSAI